MRIKADLKKFLNENLEGMAESHLEGWKKRYFGYTVSQLKFDLDINHDDSLEVEYAEYSLNRELTDNEYQYLINQFYKEVCRQYKHGIR